MTSNTNDYPVLSVEFFQHYDNLAPTASLKPSLQKTWEEAKNECDKVNGDRSKLVKRVVETQTCIIQETNNISLASSHWFYGTTLLQPQLWLSGGCQGKIERSRQAIQERSKEMQELGAALDEIDSNVLPPLVAHEQETREKLQVADDAETERKAMMELATTECPSDELQRLQEEEKALKEKLVESAKLDEQMNLAVFKLTEAHCKYRKAVSVLKTAKRHDQLGLIDKRRLESSECDDEDRSNGRRRLLESSMKRKAAKARRNVQRAENLAHEGDLLFREAFESIPTTVGGLDPTGKSPSLEGQLSTDMVRDEIALIHDESIDGQLRAMENEKKCVEGQLATAKQMATYSLQETERLEDDLRKYQVLVDGEKESIFNNLRSRVSGEAQP